MRHRSFLVFDEIIYAPVAMHPAYPYTSSSSLDADLGASTQVGIQAVAENLVAANPGTLEVWFDTSSDGINWAAKSLVANILATTLPASGEKALAYGCDDGSLPSFGRGRIRLMFSSVRGGSAAHVRVFVTFREPARVAFSTGRRGIFGGT